MYYWWHRARHQNAWLWRHVHRFHHSAERIEIIASFYKTPLEITINGVLSSFILYCLLGCSPAQASIAILMTGIAELFYHWNIKTPHWLGYLIQRPESHCVHHQQNHHHHNYSDLPMWDILFGTFYNPKTQHFVCGIKEVQREN